MQVNKSNNIVLFLVIVCFKLYIRKQKDSTSALLFPYMPYLHSNHCQMIYHGSFQRMSKWQP